MTSVADSFGDYGRHGSPAPALRAARVFDHVVTWVIAIALILMAGLAGYSLWDANNVLEGTDLSEYRPGGPGFAELLAMNPDVCAWLTVDNTNIDYPIVQGQDNFEYLDKDATGESKASGSLFLDSECDRTFHESYEVIYGHHMEKSKMFGDLDKFLDADFFDANQTATLYLPKETLDLQVCAVLTADAYDGVMFSTPAADGRVSQVIQKVESTATYYREGSLQDGDQVIAFSTCSSDSTDARTIVLCKVVNRYAADNDQQ